MRERGTRAAADPLQSRDAAARLRDRPRPSLSRRPYAGATALLACATAVAWAFDSVGLADPNLVLAYLLGVAATAAWYGRGPSVYAAFASVLLFNFLFTEPHFTFVVDDTQYLFTFAVMLGIGLLVSTLTARVREQSHAALLRERRAETTYRFSRRLSAATGRAEVVAAAREELARLLGLEASVVLADETGDASPETAPTGAGATLSLPLNGSDDLVGELRVRLAEPGGAPPRDQLRVLETCAALTALALERERSGERARRALVAAESEKLRSALLSSVSHDLRTPLAVIAGASSSLVEAEEAFAPAERREMHQTIFDEARRLSRLVENLLHMTRLASGRPAPRKEWNVVEDLVGSALTRARGELAHHAVEVRVPEGLPLVAVDGVLMELVLINLLENAAKYSPAGSTVEIDASCHAGRVAICVSDRGPGLTAEEKAQAFEAFYRGRSSGPRGAGLGLAIGRAIAELHGATIEVEDRAGGGARFRLALPLEEQPPELGANDEGAEP